MYKSFKIDRSHSFKLLYFNLRGRAETIRLIFAAAGVPYEDVRIEFDKWPAMKPDMPWGTMPVLEVDGQRRLGKSNVICRFLAREFGLAGDDVFQAAAIDDIAENITDIREKFAAAASEKDPDRKESDLKLAKEEILPKILDMLEKLLEGGNGFLYGKMLTWADLHMFACEDLLTAGHFPSVEDALSKHPKLLKHYQMVSNLIRVRTWLDKRPKTDY